MTIADLRQAYLELKEQLVLVRLLDTDDTVEEDLIIERMDRIWWEMTPQERAGL